jgi:hypothetical protein
MCAAPAPLRSADFDGEGLHVGLEPRQVELADDLFRLAGQTRHRVFGIDCRDHRHFLEGLHDT